MAADVTIQERSAQTEATQAVRRRSPTFGLSWRILALVVAAVMTAEIAIFLPSIARFRSEYLNQLIESGTLAALALDATPDNMVTEEVKRTLLDHARVDAVVLIEPNKPKRALMNIEPKPTMPAFNLKPTSDPAEMWHNLVQAVKLDGPDSAPAAQNARHFARDFGAGGAGERSVAHGDERTRNPPGGDQNRHNEGLTPLAHVGSMKDDQQRGRGNPG